MMAMIKTGFVEGGGFWVFVLVGKRQGTSYTVGFGRAMHAPFYPFYFWLNPKVTKDQEPIKGDFSFAKPRTLFTASCFYRGSV